MTNGVFLVLSLHVFLQVAAVRHDDLEVFINDPIIPSAPVIADYFGGTRKPMKPMKTLIFGHHQNLRANGRGISQ